MSKAHIQPDWGRLWGRTLQAVKEWQLKGGSPWLDVSKMRLIVHYCENGVSSDAFYPDGGIRLVVNGYSHTTEQYLSALMSALCDAAWQCNPQSRNLIYVGARYPQLTSGKNKFANRAAPTINSKAFKSSLHKYLATLDAWIADETIQNADKIQS